MVDTNPASSTVLSRTVTLTVRVIEPIASLLTIKMSPASTLAAFSPSKRKYVYGVEKSLTYMLEYIVS